MEPYENIEIFDVVEPQFVRMFMPYLNRTKHLIEQQSKQNFCEQIITEKGEGGLISLRNHAENFYWMHAV